MKLTIPIKTVNVSNQREHWTVRQKRVKSQREAVAIHWLVAAQDLREQGRGHPPFITGSDGFKVFITRIAPRMLDPHDGLSCALKPIADEVAKQLGVDDRDKRICWEYHQCKGKPKQYGVEIEILPCPLAPLAGGRE